MKKIITHIKTVLIALVGFIGALLWAIFTSWEMEPIILLIISSIELIAFAVLRSSQDDPSPAQAILPTINQGNVHINVNIKDKENHFDITSKYPESKLKTIDREAIIDFMKSRIKILFIDDDKNFNMVKILKESGWRNTKSIVDVRNIDIPVVKEAHILYVDINGVGRLLNLSNEGLDLSLMIKQRYPKKKVGIYSANRTTNAFHEAWDICDFKLEKNALPNQFQNLVENYSVELYNIFK